MVINIKESLKIVNKRVKDYLHIKMVTSMMVIGLIIHNMVKEHFHG